MQIDATDAATGFWAARGLVHSVESAASPRHARKVSPRYALNVGRVGALAVSLGIGLGIASAATGVAYAESDTDSTSNATAGPASKPAKTSQSAKTTKPSKSSNSASGTDTKTTTPAGPASTDPADNTKNTQDTKDTEDAEDTNDKSSLDDDDLETTNVGGGTGTTGNTEEIDDVDTVTGDETASVTIDADPPQASGQNADPAGTPVPVDAVLPVVTGGAATLPTDPAPTGNDTSVVPGKVTDADAVGTVVANLVSPLVTSKQAASPLTDTVLTYIRRILSHTFSNKTPVVNGVNVTTILGVTTVTIDADDPNGDPLTYEIVSGSGPANGLLVPTLFPGVFTYIADPLKLLQGPVQDTFTIRVRDDSEHLTGSLGGIQRLFESLARALGFAQRDNYDQVVSLTVNPIIDLPGTAPFVVTIGGTTYRLGSDGVKPLTSVSITDLDSGNVKGATVKVTKTDLLTSNVVSGDVLGFADTDKITGSYNATTGVLTLTGIATKAEYEAALESVTFTATQVIDGLLGIGTVGRTLTVVVTDDSNVSNSLLPGTAYLSVDYALPGSKPVITVSGSTPKFVLGKGAVAALTAVSISDTDSTKLTGAKVTVTAAPLLVPTFVGGDKLNFSDTALITGSYNTSTGVLTLSGTATLAEYRAALQSITFSATQGGGLLGALADRTVTVTVTDDGATGATSNAESATVKVANPAPPSVSLSGAIAKFILGKSPVAALPSVTITDSDSSMLSGAKVSVQGLTLGLPSGYITGDALGFTNGNGISVLSNSGGVLTLTGSATLAAYQAALQSITFSATQAGGLFDVFLDRRITVTVTDETNATSDSDSATVKVANPAPPSVSLSGAIAKFILGKSPVAALPSVTITDSDSSMLSGAKVSVQGLTLGLPSGYITGDALGFTNGNGISVLSNSGGVLTLTGSATLAAYQAALQSITFSATQAGGVLNAFLDRRITVTVTDETSTTSDSDSTTVTVAKPASPSLSLWGTDLLGSTTVVVNKAERLFESATVEDSDSEMLSKAVVSVKLQLNGDYVSGDTLNYVNANGITLQSNSSGVLTLTGNATKAAYKAALESITFKATSGGGLFNAPLPRTLTVTLTDDSGLTGSKDMTVFLLLF